MTTTTIGTIATKAMLQKSITPTVFLLGFYGEPAIFKRSYLGEKFKAMWYKERGRYTAAVKNRNP